MTKHEIKKWLKENGYCIDLDKEVEAMKRLGCLYFSMSLYNTRITIDLRNVENN